MIAASDPQEFVPNGRQQLKRHPGEVVTQSRWPHVHPDSFLLQRFSEVAISDSNKSEWWILRPAQNENTQYDEELYVNGKTAVWSSGTLTKSESTDLTTARQLHSCYTCETPIKHAVFCTFYSSASNKTAVDFKTALDNEPKGIPSSGVCLVDGSGLKIFMKNGQDYIVSLNFQVLNIWECKYGIIMEREVDSTRYGFSNTSAADSVSSHPSSGTSLFCLQHPLNDVAPLIMKQGSNITYVDDHSIRIIFVSSDPSLCLLYDAKIGLHSIWMIRRVFTEELKAVCPDMEFSVNSVSMLYRSANSGTGAMGSFHQSFNSKAHLGVPTQQIENLKSSPLSGISPQSSRSSPASIYQSPTWPGLARSSTPSPQGFASLLMRNTFLSPAVSTTSTGSANTSHDSRLTAALVPEPSLMRPVPPELCIEYLWGETSTSNKDVRYGPASKAFLTIDQVDHTYLCYLVPTRRQLLCARIERANKGQLIFGIVSGIPARDACPLPDLRLLITVDYAGSIIMYSGTSLLGKVHIGGITSTLASCSYTSLSHDTYSTPKYPKKSNIITSSRPPSSMEPSFGDDDHLLSPVTSADTPLKLSCNLLATPVHDNVVGKARALSTPLREQLLSVRDPVGNRVTLEYNDGSQFRISFPHVCTSQLVKDCLDTLKQVLQRDLAMQVVVKWYTTRNAPGTQDISPYQEWNLFIGVLLELLGYDVEKLPIMQDNEEDEKSSREDQSAKRMRESDSGTEVDWQYLLSSSFHQANVHGLNHILSLNTPVSYQESKKNISSRAINSSAPLFSSIRLILYSLHLLYEDFKLNTMMAESLSLLSRLLHQLATDLRMFNYVHHYWLDNSQQCSLYPSEESQIPESELQKLPSLPFITEFPPNIFRLLYNLLREIVSPPYPYITKVNKRSKDIIQLTALLVYGSINSNDRLLVEPLVRPIVPPGRRESVGELSAPDANPSSQYPMPYRAVLLMVEMGYKRVHLSSFPAGVALILNDIIYRCRGNPPPDWPEEAYNLILRQDLEDQCNQSKTDTGAEFLAKEKAVQDCKDKAHMTGRIRALDEDDGMEGINMEILNLIFNEDHRVAEVRRLLQSSQPVKIAITQRPEVSDHEFIEEQEKYLLAVCTRTMALPVGRGMFTLRTVTPVITETLPIPTLCLTGRAPPRNTTVDLTHIEVVPNMNLWPLFHNGVSAGLRITTSATDIDSNWIVFNKPKGNNEVPPTEHAGFLMALGLNGHLRHLVEWNTYEYLVKCHEMTSVGVLLGVAATKRGTMDAATTKLMSVHIEALLPPTSLELDIPHNIQVAALLGVGLLYEGTAHRHIAEVLLSEIGRPPGPEMENCVDRESYSLAAGLALGLVILGKGSSSCGLGDLAIPDTLHYYMVGGLRRPLTGAQREKYKSPSYQIREGECVNIDVTSPGATLATGMMFFNTGNMAVADWMKAPDTQYLLEFIRPDFLLLRIVARSLILWNDICPTVDWVKSHVPEAIRPYCLVKPSRHMPDYIDYETMSQAYCNIVAGACMSIGLKFAGSASHHASSTLLKFAKMFTSLSSESIAELAGKSTIETCLNVIVLSLAMVMCGTGDLNVLRLCRHLRSRVGPTNSVVTYGSHLATHMAIGLLFLGGGRYTLSTSPSAVAAMICAFFPKFPTHSNDNRYHLQAFRHLYVLAVEPRLLVPRDIDHMNLCYVHLNVLFLNGLEIKLKAPCLLPELNKLREVRVEDDRYWSVVFQRNKNWGQLEKMLSYGTFLGVKQKAGYLSYQEDPHGFRSLLAQTLTRDNATSWSVSASSILSFSSEPSVVKMTQLFLEDLQVDRENHSNRSRDEIQLLTSLVYECVTQDKLEVLPVLIALLKMSDTLHVSPNVSIVWQIKLLYAHVLCHNKKHVSSLVSFDFALSVHQYAAHEFEQWEQELKQQINNYARKETMDKNLADRVVSYVTYFDFPCQEILLDLMSAAHNIYTKKDGLLPWTILKIKKLSTS